MTLDVTVYLSRAVLQTVADPSTAVVCGTSGRGDAFDQQGEFRSYANGVTRLILGSTKTRSLPITLRALTPDQVTRVRAMIGKTCLFRDTYGRRIFGSFLSVDVSDIPNSGLANTTLLTDITISFRLLDYTEAV